MKILFEPETKKDFSFDDICNRPGLYYPVLHPSIRILVTRPNAKDESAAIFLNETKIEIADSSLWSKHRFVACNDTVKIKA